MGGWKTYLQIPDFQAAKLGQLLEEGSARVLHVHSELLLLDLLWREVGGWGDGWGGGGVGGWEGALEEEAAEFSTFTLWKRWVSGWVGGMKGFSMVFCVERGGWVGGSVGRWVGGWEGALGREGEETTCLGRVREKNLDTLALLALAGGGGGGGGGVGGSIAGVSGWVGELFQVW